MNIAGNIKMFIEYDGSNYVGWQKQPGIQRRKTIQGELERVLSQIFQHTVVVSGAGRTDSGVHAYGQVANFYTSKRYDLFQLRYSVNRLLPSDIYVKNMIYAPINFHARFNARSRMYRYTVIETYLPLLIRYAAFSPLGQPGGISLNIAKMNEATRLVIGEHDFSTFSVKSKDCKSKLCVVTEAFWVRDCHYIYFFIRANRFLRSMVRMMVGTFLLVGREKLSVEAFKDIFNERNNQKAAAAAPSQGLTLWEVDYQ